ncbi:MAG TPA: pitrilysin family protein [Sandaracinaceae bacterium]
MRARVLAALLVLAGCAARAPIPPPRFPLAATPKDALAPPPSEPWPEAEPALAVSTHRLENGLTLYVAPRAVHGLTSVAFLSRATAIYDERAPPAVTHALARLLLRATRVGDRVVDDFLEAEGFRPSVTLTDDGLYVAAVVDAAELPRYLAALRTALTSPALRESDLERVRSDDGERLDARMSSPYGLLDDRLTSMLYASGEARAYSLGAWLEDLRTLTREAIAARHAQLIDASECALVIAGDVDEPEVSALAARLFGALADADGGPSIPAPRYRRAGVRAVGIVRPLMRSYVRLVEAAPPIGHPDHAAFLVLEQLLGGMFTARLNLALRERNAASYGLHARYGASRAAGVLEIETAVDPAHVAGVLRAIASELSRMRGEGGAIEPRELAIAKTRARELSMARADGALGLATVLAEEVLAGREPGALLETARAIERLERADVEAAARRWLRPAQAPIAVIGAQHVLQASMREAGIGAWEIVAAPERRRR